MNELNELKDDWQKMTGSYKSGTELLKMTKINNHPTFKKLRLKLLIEVISISALLLVYYDAFDGDRKPLYANLLLVISMVLYIITGILGYRSMQNPVEGPDLKTSLRNNLSRVIGLSKYAMLFSLLYTVCLLIFFTSTIHFTKEKAFLLLGLIIILSQLLLWSYRIWRNRIKNLERQATDLESPENI